MCHFLVTLCVYLYCVLACVHCWFVCVTWCVAALHSPCRLSAFYDFRLLLVFPSSGYVLILSLPSSLLWFFTSCNKSSLASQPVPAFWVLIHKHHMACPANRDTWFGLPLPFKLWFLSLSNTNTLPTEIHSFQIFAY